MDLIASRPSFAFYFFDISATAVEALMAGLDAGPCGSDLGDSGEDALSNIPKHPDTMQAYSYNQTPTPPSTDITLHLMSGLLKFPFGQGRQERSSSVESHCVDEIRPYFIDDCEWIHAPCEYMRHRLGGCRDCLTLPK